MRIAGKQNLKNNLRQEWNKLKEIDLNLVQDMMKGVRSKLCKMADNGALAFYNKCYYNISILMFKD